LLADGDAQMGTCDQGDFAVELHSLQDIAVRGACSYVIQITSLFPALHRKA